MIFVISLFGSILIFGYTLFIVFYLLYLIDRLIYNFQYESIDEVRESIYCLITPFSIFFIIIFLLLCLEYI